MPISMIPTTCAALTASPSMPIVTSAVTSGAVPRSTG